MITAHGKYYTRHRTLIASVLRLFEACTSSAFLSFWVDVSNHNVFSEWTLLACVFISAWVGPAMWCAAITLEACTTRTLPCQQKPVNWCLPGVCCYAGRRYRTTRTSLIVSMSDCMLFGACQCKQRLLCSALWGLNNQRNNMSGLILIVRGLVNLTGAVFAGALCRRYPINGG